MNNLEEFQRRIAYTFKNSSLLVEALTHRSYSFEKKSDLPDNQRLEFFGDAILELISSEYLFGRYTASCEGELTKMRSAMTRGEALYELAVKLDLDNYLYLGKGEKQLKGKNEETRVIDAFEAIIAAIYLDSDMASVKEFYLRLVKECWSNPFDLMVKQNPKGSLQELTQKKLNECPEYQLKGVSGQEHEPVYEVEVCVRGQVLGLGKAGSRKKAEELAAKDAHELLLRGDIPPKKTSESHL